MIKIHPTAEVSENAVLGEGTCVWNNTQIREHSHIGQCCVIGKNVYIDTDVIVGDNVKIQNNSSLYRNLTIEQGVFIGPHVIFTNDKYPRAINPDGTLKKNGDWTVGTTIVKFGASIGAGAVILPEIIIGKFALVGSGSVVTKNVPNFAIVIGNPAHIAGYVCKCAKKLTDTLCKDCGMSLKNLQEITND